MSFGWLHDVEIIGIALLVLALMLVWLTVRRRWLARNGGTFECSMRRPGRSGRRPGTGNQRQQERSSTSWALGVARYSGENLQWFRFFSFSWRPKISYHRADIAVLDRRLPTPAESASLYVDQEIVSLGIGTAATRRHCDLAMTPDSVTGMLSWLEAAPRDVSRY